MTEFDEPFSRLDGAFNLSVEKECLYTIYFVKKQLNMCYIMVYGHIND